MKKYIKPTIEVIRIKVHAMNNTSIPMSDNGVIDGDDSFVSSSKRNKIDKWDDDYYE